MKRKGFRTVQLITSVTIGLISMGISVLSAALGLFDSTPRGLIISGGVGFFCGFVISIFESYSAIGPVKRLALPLNFLVKVCFYTVILFIVNFFGCSVKYTGNVSEIIAATFADPSFQNSLPFSIALSVFFNIFYIFINLIGGRILIQLLMGRYHSPKEEDRIFMFLDIKSSTTIAEKIGHLMFIKLLNDFFFDMSEGVLLTHAEIYKYVGDEIILTWKTPKGIRNANCINLFFMQKEMIESKKEHYMKTYGLVPEFKAGLHCGKVVTGELGILRIEIGYLGDVLNTTARIESLCNEKGEGLLISGDLLDKLELPPELEKVPHGDIILRGKEKAVAVYGIRKAGINPA